MLRVGNDLELVGGLTASGTSSTTVLLWHPATGGTQTWGRLATASHDAAGAMLGGQGYVFGGGESGSSAAVQRLRQNGVAAIAAHLPRPRSDLAAVSIGGSVYLIGGYDGSSLASAVLRSTDGTSFTAIASLPVPVRYPAIVGQGTVIWIFGGQAATGSTSVIQRVDVSTGRASVVGRLPSPLSGAAALLLGGQIFICGGTNRGRPISAIRRFDATTGRTTLVGQLPNPLSNVGSAVLGNTGLLLGGETPALTSRVLLLHLVPAPSPAPTS